MTSAEFIVQRLLPIMLASLVTGCTLGPNFQEPVVATPQAYRTPAELVNNPEDLRWWELFDDPLLVTLVTTALDNNRDV
jgi:multidrug efflux system outer membrane protein